MTNLERVCLMYDFVLALVTSDKKVTVRTKFYSVDFWRENDMYHMHTEKVNASSEYLHSLYDLVTDTIERTSLCEDIEILLDGKVFVVIKD